MGTNATFRDFVRMVTQAKNADDLGSALSEISARLGFDYFALTHHVDIVREPRSAIRVTNYPLRWADYYDENALGVSDPVHRASHVTSVGFSWSDMPNMIPLTANDRRMLTLGREQGIGDGFTVPANVPGEARGSCSFANPACRPADPDMLPVAQLVGAFAFEGARRLWTVRRLDNRQSPALTDRQRDCVFWVARGKSDWEISRILGVSHETVTMHVKQARERYGVQKRTLLAIHALFDGTLSFTDIFKR
jgi:LuxR family quorum-sensing system transcriptional regulator CciR